MSTTTTNNKVPQTMTVHKSLLFRTMTIDVVQTIVTHNIAKNINVNDLTAAVFRLVDRNPILTGTFFRGDSANPGIFVQTHQFDTFVYHLDATKNPPPSPANLSSQQLTEYCQTYMEPLLPPSIKGSVELKEQAQLFAMHVMELPDGYIYYAPFFSHALGDGATYYNLLEELNAILATLSNKATSLPPRIAWETPVGTTFNFTHQATHPSFWISMILCIIVNAILGFPKTQRILLSVPKIQQAKQEQLQQSSDKNTSNYLSTNDIITAAICQAGAAEEYHYVLQSINYRKRIDGGSAQAAGNISRAIPLTTARACDPHQCRQFVDSLAVEPNVGIPFWPTIRGSGYNQTSWASIQKTLDGTIFHTPLQAIVDGNDIPIVIIYQPNDDEIGIIHKLRNIDPSKGLLGQLLVDDSM